LRSGRPPPRPTPQFEPCSRPKPQPRPHPFKSICDIEMARRRAVFLRRMRT
jgi:hypothetical protein